MKIVIFSAIVGLFVPTLLADAPGCAENDCDWIYALDLGWFNEGECGVDPQKGTSPEYAYRVCPCMEATWTQAATFIGADGQSTKQTISSTLSPQSTTTVKFRYGSIKNTDIMTGAMVYMTQEYDMPTATYYPSDVIYTNLPKPSINFAVATSTVQAVSTSIVPSTTTITNTATTILAPVTVQCITGTRTIIAPTRRTTISTTVTPRAATLYYNTVTTRTSTMSCLPSSSPRKRAVDRRQGIEGRGYENPNCSLNQLIAQTTYTTSTSMTTTTSVTVLTSTIPTTTMTTSTSTPPPVCTRVRTTRTITPVITYTMLYIAARPTTRVTITNTVNTVVVATPLVSCTPATPVFSDNSGAINAK